MENLLYDIGNKALQKAREKGLEAEAFLMDGRDLNIEVRNGQVQTLKQAGESGIGVRVVDRGRLGFAYSTDLTALGVENVVGAAANIGRYASPERHYQLPNPAENYASLDLYDPQINEAVLEAKIALALEMESYSRGLDKRIARIDQAGYQEAEYSILIMNNRGLRAFKKVNLCGINLSLVAEEVSGQSESGFSFMLERRYAELNPEHIAREAVQRAVRLLGGRPLASASMPCIFEPYVVSKFLSVLASMVDAEAVCKGRSLLAGRLGQLIFSPGINIIDDSLIPAGIGSTPFDSEGVPGQKTVLVSAGVLENYLYDYQTAWENQCASTGSARRSSFRSLPGVGVSNLVLEAGDTDPEAMIKGMGRGFYITDVMGMHTINPVSGQFSVGAAGLEIENGQLGRAVRGMTIAGNLRDLFRDVYQVGTDIRYFGSRGAPSISVEALSVAGQ